MTEVVARHVSRRYWSGHAAADTSHCAFCGDPLPLAQAMLSTICRKSSCLARRDHKKIEAHRQRKRQACDRLTDRIFDRMAERYHAGADGVARVRVPVNTQSITMLSEKRKRRFRDHLQKMISNAFAGLLAGNSFGPIYRQPTKHTMTAEQQSKLGAGCTTCRGYCCQAGQDHAFIDESVIQRFVRANPGIRPRQVLAAYLSRLGWRTYDASCLYHGDTGCTLPRAMRSNTCNNFQCEQLEALLERLKRAPTDTFSFIAGTEEQPIRGLAISPAGSTAFEIRDRCCEEVQPGAS